jgi:hypothetical protein
MIKPYAVAETTKALRLIYVTAAILCLGIVFNALHSSSASALELLPDVASVDLPIGNTILDPIVEPVTDVTNEILPVDVETSDETLALTVDPDTTSNTPPILQLSVQAPVADIIPIIAKTSTPPPSPQPAPLPPAPIVTAQAITDAKKNTEQLLPSSDQDGQQPTTAIPLSPFIVGVSEFLARIIPDGAKNLLNNLARKDLNIFPYLMSAVIFLSMVLSIIGIIYTTERNNFFVNSDSRLAQLAQAHDLSQVAIVLSTLIGAAAIITCLLAFKAILPS